MKSEGLSGKTLFDHLNMITKVQDPDYFQKLTDVDKKTFSNYMILRYLSMNPNWIEIINNLQPLIVNNKLKPELAYKLLIHVIPLTHIFLKYVKNSKEINYNKDLIQLFIDHYSVSRSEAIDYLDILYTIENGMFEIQRIIKLYGYDDKEIKKLIKIKQRSNE